jgi:hypothetical protein
MMLKKISDVFEWFAKRSIDWIIASAGPQQCLWAFEVTGGGSGTDAVTFAGQSMGGQTCPEAADTSYQVVLGVQKTAANVYVDPALKTTAGFTIQGLAAAEKLSVVVVGRALNMPVELAE